MFNWLFLTVTFVGASLLFVVQPMVGKLALPIFGGTSSVWTIVMLFFTTILLLGYLYVVVITRLPKKQQLLIHSTVILLSLSWLLMTFINTGSVTSSIIGGANLTPQSSPVFSLLLVLLKTLALPCLLLATTSSLLQSWYADLSLKKSPYWLYVVSNLGSLIGLLSYPFVIEPRFTLVAQQMGWVYGLVLYSLLMFVVIYLIYRKVKIRNIRVNTFKPAVSNAFLWFILPFVSTTAMLAITMQLTTSIPPVPFIWVITLGVYLLSYVVGFINKDWYSPVFYGMLLLFLIGVLSIFTSGYIRLTFQPTFVLSVVVLFIIGVVCHRELFKKRPDPDGLPFYYLMIGIGGATASVFASIITPIVFTDVWEYPLVLVASALVAVYVLLQLRNTPLRIHSIVLGITIMIITTSMFIHGYKLQFGGQNGTLVDELRNFYGVIHVVRYGKDEPYTTIIYNGKISHGTQIVGDSNEFTPSLYYSYDSGLGYAILNHPKKTVQIPMRLGVIGLGAGTTASYCNNGDSIRFYEINPQVTEVSRKHFTYLSNAEKAGCKIDILQGDGRIVLNKELEEGNLGNFDVLAIDAFTDDSIPTHLLTSEAIDLYLSHLSDGGVIAFHISHLYLDFQSVLESVADNKNLYYQFIDTPESTWVLLSAVPIGQGSFIPSNPNLKSLWTDNYSNLLQTIRNAI